ncbi:MAG: DUF3006 domain-containing protein [Firmicutes bacterium]|nr:DUF3006 domain-containing protein [Bacillota bacterium]
MKYAIDRIEGNIAILEDINTKEKIEVQKEILPLNIKDGTILIYENNEYKLDLNEEELRRKKFQERFNRLRKKDV